MQNEMAEEHMCSSRTSGPGLEEGKLDYLHCDCPYSPFQFLTKHDGMFANLFSQLQLKLLSGTLKKKKILHCSHAGENSYCSFIGRVWHSDRL